jgi:coenzyme F420 hydrogenase subunit beta
MLIYAIEREMIDGALLLGVSESNPLETEPFVATTPSEVVAASGSKYCPSATNVGLRQVLSQDGRFAVVGLPCHIHAVRKLEAIRPRLRDKIVLHLGLFCANNNTYLGTEYFLCQHGICPENVRKIRYRAEGWPGKISLELRDGTKETIRRGTTETVWHRRALFSSAFHYDFTIPRCLVCHDLTSELADISFGDPWLPEYTEHERIGKSLAIVRTQAAHEFLSEAVDECAIVLEHVPVATVKRAQNYAYKAAVGARIQLRRMLGLETPEYGSRDLAFTARDVLTSLRYLPSHCSYHRWLWPFLRLFATLHHAQRALANKVRRAFAIRPP